MTRKKNQATMRDVEPLRVYALDSTTIDLCLSLFPWAHFRKTKSAVKMHTMINLQGKIPDFILISTGKMHDVNAMDHITWEAGCW